MELRGMYDDSLDKANFPENTWSTNTRNIVITKDKKAIANEKGFVIYSVDYPEGAFPIGHISLYNDEVIIFSVLGDLTTSDIGIIRNDGTYETIVRDSIFGFSIDHPISGRHQRNIYGHLEIVFTDNYNPVKILNITKLPFELNPDYSLVDPTQINNTLLFPDLKLPNIQVTKVESTGGNITTGSVWFTGQYEDFNGYITNTFPLTNPTEILSLIPTYANISGSPVSTKTQSAVRLSISNIDLRFKKLRLIVVRKENSQYYAESFNTININTATATLIYTGLEITENVSLDEVFVDRPSYITCSSVLTSNDILYLADVSSKPRLNIQKYVNNWKVKWVGDNVSVGTLDGSYKDGDTFFSKRTFMHNEVYGVYAVVTLNDSNYQYAFHIPGRSVRAIQNAGFGGSGKMENALVNTLYSQAPYLTEDNAITSNVRYYQTRDTSSLDGTMGFWENQNETYPDTEDFEIWNATGKIGDIGGQKVRHHKTPTIDTHGYVTGEKNAPIIGLRIEDIYLPPEIRSQIQNIEIFYAKRTGSNSTLAGRSLFFFAGITGEEGSSEVTSNAGNWNVQVTGTASKGLVHNIIRMHPFDMLVDKTSVMPNFVYNNKKLTAPSVFLSGVASASIVHFNDFTAIGGVTGVFGVADEYKVRGIYNQNYLPFNTIIGDLEGVDMSNRYCEEVFSAYFKPDTRGRNPATDFMNLVIGNVSVTNHPTHETYITDLCVWREDAYLNFNEQELVSTGYRVAPTDNTATFIFGGDGYYGTHGLVLTADNQNTFTDTNQQDGIRTKIKFYLESANPAELQYGEFYPKTDFEILTNATSNQIEYPIRFHKDYTAINSLNPVSHMDFESEDITRFPNRILRSEKAQREEKVSSWRTFLPNNYYETSRDRGRIVNLEAINSEIIIQHEYGLYITVGSDQLTTDTTTVQIGSGDVFARPPKEIIDSKDGYVGCRSKFACGKFKGGYFTVDENQGKIFIMDNSLKETSNDGMYTWFRKHLPMTVNENNPVIDNPFTRKGIISVYDEVNNRIIFTKNENVTIQGDGDSFYLIDKSFTISYSLETNSWVSMHDYIPNGIVATANKVISFKEDKIYLHNVTGNNAKYYDENIKQSYIEFVITGELSKIASSINWKSQVSNDGIIREADTLTHVMLYNNTQCSGIIPITRMKTTRNAEGIWNFNDYRDLVQNVAANFLDENGQLITSNIDTNKPFFMRKRFIGDYLCVRLIFDNVSRRDLVLSDFRVNNNVSYR